MEVYVNPYMGPCKMTAKWLVNGVVYYDIIEFTRTTIYIYVYTHLCIHVDIVLVFFGPCTNAGNEWQRYVAGIRKS